MDEALESLSSQGMGDDLEVIIQDGDVEPDLGQSDALNKGFAKARGKWLFWLNADDVLLPGALEKVVRCFETRAHGNWIAGNTKYIDGNGIVTDVRRDARWYPWLKRYYTTWTGGPSAFFHYDLWRRLGGFDVGLRFMMDIDLWTRWARAGERFIGLHDYLWGFRIHAGSRTMGMGPKKEYWKERLHLWKKHGLSLQWFWRGLTRGSQILDGSYICRHRDRVRLRGKSFAIDSYDETR